LAVIGESLKGIVIDWRPPLSAAVANGCVLSGAQRAS